VEHPLENKPIENWQKRLSDVSDFGAWNRIRGHAIDLFCAASRQTLSLENLLT
jgi:hypothetical protein